MILHGRIVIILKCFLSYFIEGERGVVGKEGGGGRRECGGIFYIYIRKLFL